jgi:acetyl esterase
LIEGQIYALKIAPQSVYKIINKSVWNGSNSIKIRIYYPNSNKKQRIIYNIHGGAFVACNLDTHDNICRILANKTQSIVIALDYRKPPESPFPASLDDCVVVLRWIKANAKILGGDSNNLILIGDSGGGLLVTALEVKLQKKLNAKAIVLINPVVDLRRDEPGPYTTVANWYLGDRDPNDSLVSPMTAKELSFFPPTLIITCEKDFLKAQGVKLYEKLSTQGVATQTIDIPQKDHLGGFWAAGHSNADIAIDKTVKFILAASK